jgi:UDP-N-acetylmuramyl pentapeptide phosphotransferase/UDP-N-acetylglucosamine-1-phosphate transferase
LQGVSSFFSVFLISLTEGFSLAVVRPILLSSAIIFLFGLWDDIQGLSAFWKLWAILAAVVLVLSGVQVRLFNENWLNIALTFLVGWRYQRLQLRHSMDAPAPAWPAWRLLSSCW